MSQGLAWVMIILAISLGGITALNYWSFYRHPIVTKQKNKEKRLENRRKSFLGNSQSLMTTGNNP